MTTRAESVTTPLASNVTVDRPAGKKHQPPENKTRRTDVNVVELNKRHLLSMLESITLGSERWRGTAVVLAVVLVFPVTVPILISRTVPTLCNCGCGNPEGACCCSARPTSPLAMRCAGSSEPDASSPQVNPLIGPPEPILVPVPELSPGKPAPIRLLSADVGNRPEIPPPRA